MALCTDYHRDASVNVSDTCACHASQWVCSEMVAAHSKFSEATASLSQCESAIDPSLSSSFRKLSQISIAVQTLQQELVCLSLSADLRACQVAMIRLF
jgi:hypothetical protein